MFEGNKRNIKRSKLEDKAHFKNSKNGKGGCEAACVLKRLANMKYLI